MHPAFQGVLGRPGPHTVALLVHEAHSPEQTWGFGWVEDPNDKVRTECGLRSALVSPKPWTASWLNMGWKVLSKCDVSGSEKGMPLPARALASTMSGGLTPRKPLQDALKSSIFTVSKGSTSIKLMAELNLMLPNSEKTIKSLNKLCFLLPSSCYNYSVFDQMANNFWSQTRCSRSRSNLKADDGGETNLKAVTVAQCCFHEDWPQKKRKGKMDISWRGGQMKAGMRREGYDAEF